MANLTTSSTCDLACFGSERSANLATFLVTCPGWCLSAVVGDNVADDSTVRVLTGLKKMTLARWHANKIDKIIVRISNNT